MVYVPTNWQDGITPVNAVNLNKLEQGLAAAVGIPADVVVPAANLLIRNRFNGADANHGFRLQGDGRLDWGPGGATAPDTSFYRDGVSVLATNGHLVIGKDDTGRKLFFGSAYDTNLYRSAAGTLKTDSAFQSGPHTVVGGDIWIQSDTGKLFFGTALDANLYRSAANALTTDGTMTSGGGFTYSGSAAGGTGFSVVSVAADGYILIGKQTPDTGWRFLLNAAGAMYWGSGTGNSDTSLYRSAAGQLKTDSEFRTGQQIVAAVGTPGQIIIGDDGAGHAALRFGTAVDTNLYRAAANMLRTDSDFWIGTGATDRSLTVAPTGAGLAIQVRAGNNGPNNYWQINSTGVMNWGAAGASAPDANLYRSGATVLKTDGHFVAGGQVGSMDGGAGQIRLSTDTGGAAGVATIYFGSALDTSLMRLSPGVLGINGVAITGGMTPPVAVVGGTKTNGQTYTITAPAAGTYIVEFGAGRHNAGAGSSSTLTSNVGGQVTYGDQDGQRGAGSALVTGVVLTAGQVVSITAALQGNATSLLNCWAKLTRIA